MCRIIVVIRLFCLYYVRCFNTTKAYQKAYGCDYATAASIGYRLLAKDGVRAEIQRLKQARLNRELLDESDIFQKYMDIAFADITDYVEFGREKVQVMGAFGPVMMTDEETELISVYYGEDISEEDANALGTELQEKYPDCEVEVYAGGQPIYYYVVSVE